MESVEDVHPVVHPRGPAVDVGSYAEYLDVVDALPKGVRHQQLLSATSRCAHPHLRHGAEMPDRSTHADELRGDGARGRGEPSAPGALGCSISRSLTPGCRTVVGSPGRGRTHASSSRSPSPSAGWVVAAWSARPATTRPTASTSR